MTFGFRAAGGSRVLMIRLADGVEWVSAEKVSLTRETETRVAGLTDLRSEATGELLPTSFAFTCETS
ncbi:hypothetical protein [Microbacterium sp. NIBRBAC000506063]|uniref:hypothetical protein n=1 Tax=Microbacterium sp. NIBRBAC000506063 TaxID=2734618 RepID=UPI001BB55063|nr:hypothetical protein [Microbacterium sp. NIBRBAC000506063]QTV80746.1 hypothetical protein KAE78_05040 [Microbacterium sp. NIBRBAC000506063]